MRYAYYQSCSLRTSGREYDRSLRAVFQKLGIELVEQMDWLCCGSTLAHNVSQLLSLALPMKNLALIGQAGFNAVIIPCTACYSRFKFAQYETRESPELAAKVEAVIEQKISPVKVLHPLEVLSSEEVLARIKSLVKRPIPAAKVACYYGCLLVRPPQVMQFDICEYPQTMDRILAAAGITTLDWSHKVECCGGSLSLTKPEAVLKLTGHVLEDAKAVGATAISVPCTFCQLNIDSRQQEIERQQGVKYNMPVFYFTELLALALDVPDNRLLLDKHFVNTGTLLGVS